MSQLAIRGLHSARKPGPAREPGRAGPAWSTSVRAGSGWGSRAGPGHGHRRTGQPAGLRLPVTCAEILRMAAKISKNYVRCARKCISRPSYKPSHIKIATFDRSSCIRTVVKLRPRTLSVLRLWNMSILMAHGASPGLRPPGTDLWCLALRH